MPESKACFCHYVLRTSQLTSVFHFLVCNIGMKIFPSLTPKVRVKINQGTRYKYPECCFFHVNSAMYGSAATTITTTTKESVLAEP